MKTLLITSIALIFISTSMKAQRGEWRDKVESQKIAFITQKLDLSPEEAQNFWPLYNEHQDAKDKIIDGDAFRIGDTEDLSEEEARKEIDKRLQTKYEMQQLEADYTRRYLDVLPAKKVLALERAERDFRKEMLLRIQKRKGGEKGSRMRTRSQN